MYILLCHCKKNNNFKKVKIVTNLKNKLGTFKVIESVKEKRIDLFTLDPITLKIY